MDNPGISLEESIKKSLEDSMEEFMDYSLVEFLDLSHEKQTHNRYWFDT